MSHIPFRTQATIDLSAFLHNLGEIRAHMPTDALLMGVIKANGYGHGAIRLANAAGDLYDAYATATIEEALSLREAGLAKPILILGHIFDYAQAIQHDIIMTVSTLSMAQDIQAVACSMDKIAHVHLGVDTGMGRIGFAPTMQSVCEIAQIAQLSHVQIDGMFTHYATADEVDLTKARRQQQVFADFAQAVHADGIGIPLLHTSNSAALTQLEGAPVGMVRAGIIQYGLQPSADVSALKLQPILSWQACVSHVKTVPTGTTVGYGATWTAPESRIIATIPVGYADGYPRALSNRAHVLLHGQPAPIVGRVCMDQFMVDVTDIADVQVGDAATLVGTDGNAQITVEYLADMAGSFNYEFVCNVNGRVPRVYVD